MGARSTRTHDPLNKTIWYHQWTDHAQSKIAFAKLNEFRDSVASHGYAPDPNLNLVSVQIDDDNRDDRGRPRSNSARRRNNRSNSARRRNRSATQNRPIENRRIAVWDQRRFDALMDAHGIDDMGRQSLLALMLMGDRGERSAHQLLGKLAAKGHEIRNKSRWLHRAIEQAKSDIREVEEAEAIGWKDYRYWG